MIKQDYKTTKYSKPNNVMKNILGFLVLYIIAVFVLFMLINWSLGCGETYTDAAGVVHAGECWP